MSLCVYVCMYVCMYNIFVYLSVIVHNDSQWYDSVLALIVVWYNTKYKVKDHLYTVRTGQIWKYKNMLYLFDRGLEW